MATTPICLRLKCCMIAGPKLTSVWNFDAEVNLTTSKALGIGQSSRPVEPVVGDQQFDASGLGVALDALFYLDAKADVALQVGKAKD